MTGEGDIDVNQLLRSAAHSSGYVQGYDDAIRDVLKALDDEPGGTMAGAAADIRDVMKNRLG